MYGLAAQIYRGRCEPCAYAGASLRTPARPSEGNVGPAAARELLRRENTWGSASLAAVLLSWDSAQGREVVSER